MGKDEKEEDIKEGAKGCSLLRSLGSLSFLGSLG
jgi:hypothetical protein